jgi:hypothetical protein
MEARVSQFPPPSRLTRGERLAAGLLVGLAVALGVLFVYRSSFAERRQGDLAVYLRAAWAVRVGADPYAVTDHNGWHYAYPPLFAVLLSPLADAPPGADCSGLLPIWASATIYYLLNVGLLWLSVHWLASALEEASGRAAGARQWWLLRLVPILACLPPIVMTLERGQANLFVLPLVCGLAACLIRGRRFAAGLCLAGAACLKVFPAYLALVPLWRRDLRCLAGCAVGLLVGGALVPLAALGPERALAGYRSLASHVLAPGLGRGHDRTMARELTAVTATDSQSFQAAIHNSLYLDPATRPADVAPWVRRAHWLLAAAFTLLTLLAARGRSADDASGVALFVGALSVLMVITSPVCHIHYFALAVPLVLALLARSWEAAPGGAAPSAWLGLNGGLAATLALFFVAQTLPHLAPALQVPRDVGAAMYGALALWLAGCRALRRPGAAAGPAAEAGPAARAA